MDFESLDFELEEVLFGKAWVGDLRTDSDIGGFDNVWLNIAVFGHC